MIALLFSALLPNTLKKHSKDTSGNVIFFPHKATFACYFGVLLTKNVKKKHSKYTNLVMLFCFPIKIVIHEFQHFGVSETSLYTRVFAFFALWFLSNHKTLIHVSRNVLFFANIKCFLAIFAFFVGNKLKNTTKNIFLVMLFYFFILVGLHPF